MEHHSQELVATEEPHLAVQGEGGSLRICEVWGLRICVWWKLPFSPAGHRTVFSADFLLTCLSLARKLQLGSGSQQLQLCQGHAGFTWAIGL